MTDVLREIVLPKLEGVRKQGGYWMARCPAHEDTRQSLSVSPGNDQPVLFKCHAGCESDRILDAIGLTWETLCKPREDQQPRGEWTPYGPAEAVYDYTDETGTLLFQVLRAPGKRFIQRRPDLAKKSGFAYQIGDTRRVLYRLPKVIEANSRCELIYIVEGEKDVHALEAAGLTATCNPGGAGKWKPEYAEAFRDGVATIVTDKDDPGYAHARQVAATLKGIAAAVEIVEAAEGKDVSDHLAAGLTTRHLVRIWDDGQDAPDLAPDLPEFLDHVDPPQDFVLGDLLERGDRLILTGGEGAGKSTLARQIGVCIAAGLHPFHMHDVPPRRVLLIDCENSERQSRRELRPLARKAEQSGHPVGRGMMRLIHRPMGLNLATEEHAAWLLERVTAHEPDLLIIGPLYKLHNGDLNEESAARTVVAAIDAARIKANCAVLIESHSPHGDARGRTVRPAGSSLFLRWPEYGFGLVPDGKAEPGEATRFLLKSWRGGRDRWQRWPTRLHPGIRDGWPWIVEPEQSSWT